MGGPGWKRGLFVVLVGIVMGIGGLGSLPEAHAAPSGCQDCYDKPDRGTCSAERPCGSAERPSGCQDCYDRPARQDCAREPSCGRDDRARGCGDCYDRGQTCRDRYRSGPCDYGYYDDYDYGYYDYGCRR